jgi:phosphoglycolate phosphatase-like HAD superfamily hydrolase
MLPDNIVSLSVKSWKEIAIAFDFDGTLVDCKVRQVEVLRSIIRRLEFGSLTVNFDEWWNLKRNGLNTCDALVRMGVKPPIAETITKYWIELIEEPQWLDLDIPFKDTLSFLKYLKENENKLYLITARKSDYCLLNQLKKLNLQTYFNQYVTVSPFDSMKEKGEVLRMIRPSFFVGDSETDYYAALSSGTNFIGLSSGQRSPEFLKRKGIDGIINNLLDLLNTKINEYH